MLNFFKFFISKHFWLSILGMVFLSCFLVWFTFFGLDMYTHHGESITVPDLRNFTLQQVKQHLKSKDLRYTIIDSTFVAEKSPETVIEQNPEPGAKVKENRRIYLTINAKEAPMIKVPNIIDASLRSAEGQLGSVGLSVGELEYRADYARNAVLGFMYNGKELKPGDEIPKGSLITLILGDGLGDTRVPIPNLLSLSYHEAKIALSGYGLNIGVVMKEGEISDLGRAIVYKQSPEPSEDESQKITIGEPVDLFLMSRAAFNAQQAAAEAALPIASPAQGQTIVNQQAIVNTPPPRPQPKPKPRTSPPPKPKPSGSGGLDNDIARKGPPASVPKPVAKPKPQPKPVAKPKPVPKPTPAPIIVAKPPLNPPSPPPPKTKPKPNAPKPLPGQPYTFKPKAKKQE